MFIGVFLGDGQIMERFEFKSETRELLQMMAHSLYSSKDVCLRELISNASDALDRRRFEAVKDASKGVSGDEKLEIRIHADKDARTLTIEDNGDGMTREELIQNLGTIAHSGTKAFMENLKKANEADKASLIGQFGVGFYSVFILADSVTVTTKRIGTDKAYTFRSTGDGSYTIEDAEKDSYGTTIVMNLRPSDEEDKLSDFTD
ncbi:MAG: ATP-binding protein, partial [Proteobacteria bacterium]|nr:ATP-binding protein [Pseudomonadota bacterium]